MTEAVLAKSAHGQRLISLDQHAEAVVRASEALFGADGNLSRLGKEWSRFFGLDAGARRTFLRCLRIACALHDIGKANVGFQQAARRLGDQFVRHEHLSALLLRSETVRPWLEGLAGSAHAAVVGAVLSHHANAKQGNLAQPLIESLPALRFLFDRPEIEGCFALAAAGAPLPAVSNLPSKWDRKTLSRAREEFKRWAHEVRRSMRSKGVERRLLVGLKAALIAADAAGSALVREGHDVQGWIASQFAPPLLSGDWVREKVIRPRIREIENLSGQRFRWNDIQQATPALGPRALLVSACGSGKTLAAWRWIQARLAERPAARVIFLYPTRATATEGFRDYVSWAGGEFAALQHGTAEFDLEGMFDNPADRRRGSDYRTSEQRLFALAYWSKRVFSATVDSYLAFMANQYASMCMLPVLCDSVLVIDEVHSFDRNMTAALREFLKFFDLPVLCMTATLTQDKRELLTDECGLEMFPTDETRLENLYRATSYPRYRLTLVADAQEAMQTALQALRDGRKVLWVVNTVDRCQQVFCRLRTRAPAHQVLCYHSRFRLKDRKQRHEELIRTFRRGPVLAVTTQVCEMSLDLDADVLVTESAPVPALIQRMGRCCREALPRSARIGDVLAYRAQDSKPYQKEEIDAGWAFLNKMGRSRPISQADLAAYLRSTDIPGPVSMEEFSHFLDSGLYAMARDASFREADDYTLDAVLDEDRDRYLEMRQRRDPRAKGLIIPVPRRYASRDERLGRLLRVAPASHYDPTLGFCKKEQTNG